ncbi:F0F1 ATP synthase subunit epsilon [Ruania halotolerans]|uniref:F0F1 ATP synthase subunit epsilon n=1 Tax=Ruania halotolerans TaxID=2897773 RepID=UPI001E4272AF|nr:F0F1 ATP synthase subunit epsilon [Ruania halotolerans]UFU07658.1 F0F1 ATP synthase subunit epsilon [Ruania halotolerans]
MPLTVEMVSADRTWWSGEATSVGAPAADGDMGIRPGHQPVLAVLRPGMVRVHPADGEPVTMEVSGGFLSVDHDDVTIVVDPTTSADATGAGEN